MLLTPASTSRSQTSCAARRGVAITPIADRGLAHDGVEVVEGETSSSPTTLAARRVRVVVEEGRDLEAARGEPAVVGERVTEVADTDDDDRPVLGQPDLAGDLVAQVVDVVPDATRAVGAEVGEVLAELRGVDAGGDWRGLRARCDDVAIGQAVSARR